MDEIRARKILRKGADAYSRRMIPGLVDWVDRFSRDSKGRGLVDFYLAEVVEINRRSPPGRLYDIPEAEQERILGKYLTIK